jgi:type VI secretion system secreted protein Hcp
MASNIFLKIDGIDGESTDDRHPREIELLSYSFGVSNSGSFPSGGGGGAGKASFQDFHFVSRTQKSSPRLFLACASGQHIKFATMTMRKAGNRTPDFYKVILSDVLVTSFQQGASADGVESVPTEQISLNFAKIEIDYTVQDAKGALGETVQAIWDLAENSGGD